MAKKVMQSQSANLVDDYVKPNKTVKPNGNRYIVVDELFFERLSIILEVGYTIVQCCDGFYNIYDLSKKLLFFRVGEKVINKVSHKIQKTEMPTE